jgi:predicted dehydrogenase
LNPATVAIVGCGRMGRQHLASAQRVADLDAVAVVDPYLDSAACTALGSRIETLDAVLDSPRIEGVVVAAPTAAHDEIVTACLAHGKHVLCEKPLTLDPDGDSALERLAADRRRVLHVGFWRRFSQPYQVVKRVLAAGSIGPVRTIHAAQWDAHPPASEFCDVRVSGGLEVDCGIHEFDLAAWLLEDTVTSVVAYAPEATPDLAQVDDVDNIHGLATLHDDRVMSIDLSRTAGHRDTIRTEFVGTHGALVAELGDSSTVVLRADDRCAVLLDLAGDPIPAALDEQLRAFAQAILIGRAHPNAGGPRDSRRALSAALTMRRARLEQAWCAVTDA